MDRRQWQRVVRSAVALVAVHLGPPVHLVRVTAMSHGRVVHSEVQCSTRRSISSTAERSRHGVQVWPPRLAHLRHLNLVPGRIRHAQRSEVRPVERRRRRRSPGGRDFPGGGCVWGISKQMARRGLVHARGQRGSGRLGTFGRLCGRFVETGGGVDIGGRKVGHGAVCIQADCSRASCSRGTPAVDELLHFVWNEEIADDRWTDALRSVLDVGVIRDVGGDAAPRRHQTSGSAARGRRPSNALGPLGHRTRGTRRAVAALLADCRRRSVGRRHAEVVEQRLAGTPEVGVERRRVRRESAVHRLAAAIGQEPRDAAAAAVKPAGGGLAVTRHAVGDPAAGGPWSAGPLHRLARCGDDVVLVRRRGDARRWSVPTAAADGRGVAASLRTGRSDAVCAACGAEARAERRARAAAVTTVQRRQLSTCYNQVESINQ